MLRKLIFSFFLLIVLVVGGLWFTLRYMSISALEHPGRTETFLATQFKRRLIARGAQAELPPEPPATADNASDGHMIYGSLCAGCHGYDGRTPTPLGNSFYQQAPSLASPDIQRYSNKELFVIIHGGVRMTGMPAFGVTQSPAQIWSLVHYVRSLPMTAPAHH
jgi:mono/diheme cytochrome c family protein